MTDSDIMQSLSPLTALAQRYGLAPYSLFTALITRATPEEFLYQLTISTIANTRKNVKMDDKFLSQ